MKEVLVNKIKPYSQDIGNKGGVESLAQQWAKKYLQNLQVNSCDDSNAETNNSLNLKDLVSQSGRQKTAENLMLSLRSMSAKAWNKTEALLSAEVKRHRIDPKLINPWEIAGDAFKIYEKALDVYTKQAPLRQLSAVMRLGREDESLDEKALEIYTEQVAPSQLATVIGTNIGAIRQKYTKDDPRVIGFVSMQFHYTSQMLLEPLSPIERSLVGAYFKVIDDHLYMPLQRTYEAAAKHDYHSTALSAVQQLLPASTQIAKKISQRVIEIYPTYRSYTGRLSDAAVKTSSIRDVEMFQVYLWVCTLEGSIAAIQQELFPLCVMLYPTLKVQWELIRQMLHLLGQEISMRLNPKQADTVMPYFQVLWHMFSPEVFGELGLERKSNNFDDDTELWESLFG
jgi:Phycobilisome protein